MSTWIDATKESPPIGLKVIATYKNRLGKRRLVMAMWAKKFTIPEDSEYDELDSDYSEEDDTYYVPEGWYELIDNWDNFSFIRISEGNVDYWTSLPIDYQNLP